MKDTIPKIRPIRFCTGGCATGQHAAHYYATDPVDGPLGREYLCPGNMQQALEILEEETGEPTLDGFIAEEYPESLHLDRLLALAVIGKTLTA